MRWIILFSLSMFSISISYAQQLQGRVLDAASSSPLVGATVKLSNKKTLISDKDGNFSFDCNSVKSITVTYIGYEAATIYLKNCTDPITVNLRSSAQSLNEVEVSATSSQNKSLLYQPLSIVKVGALELRRGTGLFLDETINANVPGVSMNRRSVNGGQQFNIRGYGNGTRGTRGTNSNFDGQGYKVYLNGIAITDAEGVTVMDDIDFGAVSNVEVTKGPSGTLYGLAIAGAINLRTVQPANGVNSISQEVMLGNYGLQRYNTQLQVGREKFSLLVNYGHQLSDGITFHNQSRKDFLNLVASFRPSEKQTINTFLGYSNSYDERFGELTESQWQNNDYSGNPEYLKRDAHSAVRSIRAGISHEYRFNKYISNTSSVFGNGFFSDASSAGGWTDKNFINYGLRSTLDIVIPLGDKVKLSGLTGIETQGQRGQTVGYSMKKSPFDTTTTSAWTPKIPFWLINAATSNFLITTGTTTLFTEWTLGLPADFSLTAGIGASNQKINLNDRFNTATITKPSIYDTTYKKMVSPHIAINKVINKNLALFISYSKGYKPPVSSYFFITTPAVATVPTTPAGGRLNNTLKPEEGSQIEFGARGQLLNNRLSFDIVYFNINFKNKMTTVGVASPIQPNTTLYSYVVNGGEQIHKGLEALVKFDLLKGNAGIFKAVKPFVNATFNHFRYKNFTFDSSATKRVNFDGKKVAGAPDFVFNAGVDVELHMGVYANLQVNHRDKMPITADNVSYAPAYSLLNGKLGIRKALTAHFDIDAYIGGINLTSTKYYLMAFANQLPDAFLPAPRHANVFGGLIVRYNF